MPLNKPLSSGLKTTEWTLCSRNSIKSSQAAIPLFQSKEGATVSTTSVNQ